MEPTVVEGKKLASVFALVRRVAGNKNHANPATRACRVENGALMATDLDASIRVKNALPGYSGMLDVIKMRAVKFGRAGSAVLNGQLEVGGISYDVASDYPDRDYPYLPADATGGFFIPAESAPDFVADLAIAARFVDENNGRYALKCVSLTHRPDRKSMEICGTDGKAMFISAPHPVPMGQEPRGAILLPRRICELIAEASKSMPGSIRIEERGSKIIASSDSWTVTIVTDVGQFPDYWSVVRDSSSDGYWKPTVSHLKAIASLPSDDDGAVALDFRHRQARTSGGSMTIDGDIDFIGRVGIDPVYIKRAALAVKAESVTIRLRDDKALHFNDGTGSTIIVMPIDI